MVVVRTVSLSLSLTPNTKSPDFYELGPFDFYLHFFVTLILSFSLTYHLSLGPIPVKTTVLHDHNGLLLFPHRLIPLVTFLRLLTTVQ